MAAPLNQCMYCGRLIWDLVPADSYTGRWTHVAERECAAASPRWVDFMNHRTTHRWMISMISTTVLAKS